MCIINRMTERDKMARLIRSVGLKVTKPRIAVISTLYKTGRPLSHVEIMERLGFVDKVTLYRVLDAFVKKGIVHHTFTGGRMSRFERADRCKKDRCHPHFTCRKCGRTTCLLDVKVPLLKGMSPGFKAERQRIHVEGLCPECSVKKGSAV